ncbi:MAG TPA: RNA polymerase sigma factor [Vicinamibacterales bacterium]|nr:RNA polymerase sigma factor [Vicinamibacterales bacterium]
MTATDVHGSIDAVWKMEAPKLIASLARMTRDVGLAEDLAQDALVSALEQWPRDGIPRNPGAWLMAIAKRRGIDHFRHHKLADDKHQQLGREIKTHEEPDFDAALDDDVGDDLLRLIFTACHPVLPTEARVALTLKLLAGFTTPEIARAFLAPEPTIQQRIVRAKRTLADKKIPYEVPTGSELAVRLASVLEVIYLIFNEGYSATAGDDWMRPALCEDAQRLGRVLAGLAPMEPEVHGLVALMEIQASRAAARVGPNGEPILLMDQDRRRWNRLLIQRGLAALARAEDLSRSVRDGARGPYTLQAAIAACHARAAEASHTDWPRIAALYDELAAIKPSPVIELNRAVAHGMAFGPEAGLAIADRVAHEPSLRDYPYLPGVRADLLFKLKRFDAAKTEFEKAASLTSNTGQRTLLLKRAAECTSALISS